jgi:ElaB/YqjD/DUF883 family membrane-anchored ribosome-binding protein
MAGDTKTVVADTEDLLEKAAEVSGEGFSAARDKLEEKLRSAQASLANLSQEAVAKARRTAAAADDYVHASPWPAIGIAAAAGILIGFLAARR